MDFRVDLHLFRGPLDLLLYLVRRHEVEVTEIPIAPITEQFLHYLELLQALDVNAVGDFLEMASTLMEIKSRLVLPRGGEEEQELDDPRQELVARLLEYKRFKDAASLLDERSRAWQERFPRLAPDLAPRQLHQADQPIQEVELWDLVSAWGRIVRDSLASQPASIVYDETPIHVHMTRIYDRLQHAGRLSFSSLFQQGMHKSTLVGLFLAVLELVRHYRVRAEQDQLFGEIWLAPGAATGPLDFSNVDTYEHGAARPAPPAASDAAPA
jgi:segregation and condensation protein A